MSKSAYNFHSKIPALANNNLTILFLMFLLIFLMRLPWINNLVIDWDEGSYLTVAQDVVNGGVPYKTAWDLKGPGLFFLLVPIIKLYGDNIIAIRLFTTAYLILSMYFVYLISTRLFNNKISLFPPLIYGLFFTEIFFGGLASNGELFMMLPVVIAAFLLILYSENEKFLYLLLCGFVSAVAILIKSSSFFTLLAFPIFLLFRRFRPNLNYVYFFGKEMVWFAGGGLMITLVFLAYFAYNNALHDFLFTFFIVSNKYVAAIPISKALKNLYEFVKYVVILNKEIISFLAFGSLLFILCSKRSFIQEKRITFLVILITLLSFVGVCWGRRMFPHYYLQMGLAFSLLIAFALNLIDIKHEHLTKIIYIILILLFLSLPYSHSLRVLSDLDTKESRILYGISNFIKSNTTDDDRIFVLMGNPIIYFLSGRKAPTKYFWGFHYGPRLDKVLDIGKITNDMLEAKKPKFIIFEKDLKNVTSEDLLRFTYENYKPVTEEFDPYVIFRIKENSPD